MIERSIAKYGSSIDSIRGAVARPSSRDTTRRSTTRASDGT